MDGYTRDSAAVLAQVDTIKRGLIYRITSGS